MEDAPIRQPFLYATLQDAFPDEDCSTQPDSGGWAQLSILSIPKHHISASQRHIRCRACRESTRPLDSCRCQHPQPTCCDCPNLPGTTPWSRRARSIRSRTSISFANGGQHRLVHDVKHPRIEIYFHIVDHLQNTQHVMSGRAGAAAIFCGNERLDRAVVFLQA